MRGNRTGCVFGGLAGAIVGFAIGLYFLLAGPPSEAGALFRPPVWTILGMPMILFGLLGVFIGVLAKLAFGDSRRPGPNAPPPTP